MPYRCKADDFDNKTLQIQIYDSTCELQFFSNVDRSDESKLCEFLISFPSVELLPADDQVSVKSHVILLLLLVLVFWGVLVTAVVIAIAIVTKILTDCSYCSSCCLLFLLTKKRQHGGSFKISVHQNLQSWTFVSAPVARDT